MADASVPTRGMIVVGDETTAGGVVIEGSPKSTIKSKAVALQGHAIRCLACNSIGRIQLVPPLAGAPVDGVEVALDGDLCICGCNPPPRLISSNKDFASHGFSADELGDSAAAPWLAYAGYDPAKFALPLNEQFQMQDATGKPLAGMYFSVKQPRGAVVHGTTDSRGRTERYQTEGVAHIELYLGHIGVRFPEPLAKGKTNTTPGSLVVAKSERLGKPWQLSAKGLDFVKDYEKFEGTMYDDAAGNATIGYGHLVHYGVISGAVSEKPFLKGITEPEASKLLLTKLVEFEAAINAAIRVPLHQKEYDALVIFAYNVGARGASSSKAVQAINMGMYELAPDEMATWNKGKDPKTHLLVEMNGLINRRADEIKIYKNADYKRSK